jgi:hypothetical protein
MNLSSRMSKSLSCLSKLKQKLEIGVINNHSTKSNQPVVIYTILIGDEKIGKTSLIKSVFGDGSHIIRKSPFSYYSAEILIERKQVFLFDIKKMCQVCFLN